MIDSLSVSLSVISAIFAIPIGLMSLRVTYYKFLYLKKDRYKQDCEFTCQFSEKYNDREVKEYSKMLGYAAILGTDKFNKKECRFFLKFEQPVKIVSNYMRTRNLVKFQNNIFSWKHKRFTKTLYRRILQTWYLFLYTLLATPLCFAPMALKFEIFHDKKLPYLLLSGLFFCLALCLLYCGTKVKMAEFLVLRQGKAVKH